MKNRLFLSLSILIILAFVAAAVPAIAQSGGENQRAAPPVVSTSPTSAEQVGLEPFSTFAPDWGGHWVDGAAAPFAMARFDGGYSLKQNMVYFMGGRLADSSTDGSVWSFSSGGVYSDTGVDLVTPVSNYTMNLLEDVTGWGFYIFCGRNSAGSVVDNVQVYYPDTNTAAQLGPEDNYPGSGTCTSAMNVVHNNKVYLAGGLDSFVAPYNWGETWVFDPLAPAGSRWTQITSANLNLPRAYIMGAVVDNKIYAIGGDVYDATFTLCGYQMCPQPIVEVLDLNDPEPFWNDSAAADLPEGCSEGRAFGFDSTSQYKDSDGTPLAGRIISTCGGWDVENERVYAYSLRADKWEPFPSLNRTRRNQAAEFVPVSYAGGGVMFNWGGRSGTDATLLDIPESYTVIAPDTCKVLVVDDDWDYDSVGENFGGRPYYTSALNYLGYRYQVWDTISQGVPPAATLATYDAVVWFTGYDWETPVTLAEQAELVTYLLGGGDVFLSSQEQEFVFPGGDFLRDYFGVSNITQDVTLRQVAGSPSDSLYAGLGSYSLRRPDDVVAYWPLPSAEGPYNDAILPAAGSFGALIYPGSGAYSAVRHQGPAYKSIYLGFPLEWVDTIQERAQILGTGLKWMCPVSAPTYLPLIQR